MKSRQAYIEAGRPLKTKEKKPIPKKSEKRIQKEKEQKVVLAGEDPIKEKWFKARRKEMVGTCQCGCGQKSSKFEDEHFRSSICHIFPKAHFESIQYHPLNWVERAFWATSKGSSCHTNMDNGSIMKWPFFADWEDIKERFHELSPLLTKEERSHKFYSNLEKLVYSTI